MRYIDDRYRNDPEFHQLVDLIEQMIRQARFTPSETREAAMLAQMHHELTFSRKVVFSPDLAKEIEFRCGGKFVVSPEQIECRGCGRQYSATQAGLECLNCGVTL